MPRRAAELCGGESGCGACRKARGGRGAGPARVQWREDSLRDLPAVRAARAVGGGGGPCLWRATGPVRGTARLPARVWCVRLRAAGE